MAVLARPTVAWKYLNSGADRVAPGTRRPCPCLAIYVKNSGPGCKGRRASPKTETAGTRPAVPTLTRGRSTSPGTTGAITSR